MTRAPDRHEVAADRAAEGALTSSPRTRRARAVRRPAGGRGRELTTAEAAFFEPRFGADFSTVRVVTGPAGRATSLAQGARAFTLGETITFAREPLMSSPADRRLFAHELAHVVQSRRDPGLAATVLRAPLKITRVDIYPASRKIRITLSDDQSIWVVISDKTRIDAGTYQGEHKPGRERDDVKTADGTKSLPTQSWYFDETPPGAPKWADLATSTYVLEVHDDVKSKAASEDLKQQGKKDKGEGAGDKGTGKGAEKGAGEAKGDKSGDKSGDKGAGDKGGTPGGFPGETAAEKDAKVKALLKRLKDLPDLGGTGPTEDQLKKLAEMTPAELDDVVKYLKTTGEASETPVDASAELDKYLAMSASDRELLRVNQQLMKDAKSGPLPERVRIALDSSAEANVKVAQATSALNEQMANLAKVRNKVTDPELRAAMEDADLDPIDLEKLPVFREMMMLEGLLAGASTRSPQIEESAKDLTRSIAGIRDYVLEEIAWLLAEVAGSALLGFLTGPVGAAVSVGRAAALVHRINKLRVFLQKVEKVYSTYQRITAIVAKVSNAYATYRTSETEFASRLADLERLKDLADDPNLDEVALEAALEKAEELENELVDKMLTQLESGSGVGALLEYFDLPEDATPDDLRQILLDIPKGLRELDALMSRYAASGRDLESVKLLTYKSVLVGTLLYPFVGYLARTIGDELQTVLEGQQLSDRLFDVLSSAAAGAKKRRKKGPPKTSADNRKQLGGAKRPPKAKKSKTPDTEDPKKKPKQGEDDTAKKDAAKKKGVDAADDPAKKKKDDEEAKKKDEEDAAKKKKKEEDKDPTGPEWLEVVRKVGQLKDRNKEGITKDALEIQGKKIKRKHKKVAGAVSVTAVTGKGWWRISIKRLGAGSTEATQDVLMGYRMRWEAGRKAIAADVADLDVASRTIPGVRTRVAKFKTPYDYTELDVVDEDREGYRGVKVVGRMGKVARRDIVAVEDLTGLCTGDTKDDAIWIWWYKDPSWYQGHVGELKLPNIGKSVPFPAPAGKRVDVTLTQGKFKDQTVTIGVDPSRIIKKGDTVQRIKSDRKSDNPDMMKQALKQAGYSRWDMVDLDHIHDLGLGGNNDFENLWPLNRSKNQWIVRNNWYRRGILQLDPVTKRKEVRTTVKDLWGKWFYVQGISAPTSRKGAVKWGGRNPHKKS